jgi:ActD protein
VTPYGLLAEFKTAEALLEAAQRARSEGYRRIEAYSPFPVEGLVEAVGSYQDRIPLITLIGGLVGGAGGYFMQWYSAVVAYPINQGGRPYHSWPAFVPVTFELAVLGASLAAFLAVLVLSGLPKLYHPLFNVAEFELASRSRFFLFIRHDDRRYDKEATRDFLTSLHPLCLTEVPR